MSSLAAVKQSKPARNFNAISSSSFSAGSGRSSGVSSHLAMVELKQRILNSLSKLSDRDTYQIGVEDLEKIIVSVSLDTLPMLLNCLFDSSADPKSAVKKESLRLLSFLCISHPDLSSAYLIKIVSHIVKRLKDADSGVRDACRDAIGSLSAQFLKEKDDGNGGGAGPLVGLFARPLFLAMAEQNKSLQSGAAVCMAKMVESAADPPVPSFQKLCPRISKLLNSPNYLTKASLLPVVGNLSQVGAIAPQSLESLLLGINECLGSEDWVTRKAAADVLLALATHCSNLIADKTGSTVTVLEACHFDKIKPVRDSMTEALNLWKKIAENSEGTPDNQKDVSSEQSKSEKNAETNSSTSRGTAQLMKASSEGSSNNSCPISKGKTVGIPEKAVLFLRKKAPALADKDLNPEFFQQLEKRGSGDLPVEVIVPQRNKNMSNSINEDESETNISDSRVRPNCSGKTVGVHPKQEYFGDFAREKWDEEMVNRDASMMLASDHDQNEANPREPSENPNEFSLIHGQYEESFINNRGNWSYLQRQLLHLERQQAHIMNMLQDIMGGSHDGMITLENRVRCLERIVEDMARDLSISPARRGSFAAGSEDSIDAIARAPSWRSDMDECDSPQYGASRNGQIGARRACGSGPEDNRLTKSEATTEHAGSSRRAWDKGARPIRLGEGPSARSVWQASKDEATLEAIRVAGEDNRTSRVRRVSIPEAEAMEDFNSVQEQEPIWATWSNAMHVLRVGDTDSAYAKVLSTEDYHLLVKLMEKTGPAIDHLSNDIGNEVLHAIAQFLLDQSLFNICLSWIQQLLEVVSENGPDALGTPMELKKLLLLNLHEASSTTDPPEDWEGLAPDQLLVQLASNWGIELQRFDK